MTSDEQQSIKGIFGRSNSLKYSMVLHSLLVGVLSGGVIVLYRILGEKLLHTVVQLYDRANDTPLGIAMALIVLIVVAIVVAYFVRTEPDISGSGIPQLEGVMTGRLKSNWPRVLVCKFLGGILSLGAGLSVGREGPSIQMGAAVGDIVAKKGKKLEHEQKYLLTAGASAGLAAAFNAPLAGVMFALEEVHKNFSPIVLLSAMVSAVSADMISKAVLGIQPALGFAHLNIMPIRYYWSLVLLGLVLGLSSYIFNHGIIASKRIYRKLPLRLEFKIMLPFITAGIVGMSLPVLIGGGHELIMELGSLRFGLLALCGLLLIKYLFTFVSFGSGVPGGIFFPLLAIGAVIGAIVGNVAVNRLGLPKEYLMNFIVLAMAGHFAAIVKAPITGIILIYEMTASFEHLLPLSVVVFTAMISSDLIKVEPVYDMLLEDIVHSRGESSMPKEADKKTLIELCVHLGSKADGSLVSELDLPDNILLVAVQRGKEEIIPRGETKIIAGDMLLVILDSKAVADIRQELEAITGVM